MEVVEEPLDAQETMEPAIDAGPLPEPAPALPLPEQDVVQEEVQQEPPKKARAKAKPRAKVKVAPPEVQEAVPIAPVAEAPAPKPKRAPRKPPPEPPVEPPAPHVPTLDEMMMAFQHHQYQRSMMKNAEYRSLIRM